MIAVLIGLCAVVVAIDVYGFLGLVRGFERHWVPDDPDRGGVR